MGVGEAGQVQQVPLCGSSALSVVWPWAGMGAGGRGR